MFRVYRCALRPVSQRFTPRSFNSRRRVEFASGGASTRAMDVKDRVHPNDEEKMIFETLKKAQRTALEPVRPVHEPCSRIVLDEWRQLPKCCASLGHTTFGSLRSDLLQSAARLWFQRQGSLMHSYVSSLGLPHYRQFMFWGLFIAFFEAFTTSDCTK